MSLFFIVLKQKTFQHLELFGHLELIQLLFPKKITKLKNNKRKPRKIYKIKAINFYKLGKSKHLHLREKTLIAQDIYLM